MANGQGDAGRAPGLSVAAVARRLGVAPATLRTWDRRYGLGPSEHESGAHRRYGGDDVTRLLVMRRLTLDGVAPADAARAALAGAPSLPTDLEMGEATPDRVLDAVLAGDQARCAALLRLAPPPDVVAWWTGLVEPAVLLLSRRTVVGRPADDPDALLEGTALAALRAAAPTASATPAGARPVVLVLAAPGAGAPLVLHVVAAALLCAGVDARVVRGPYSARHAVELAAMTRAVAAVTVTQQVADDLRVVEGLAREREDLPQLVLVPTGQGARLPVGRSVQRTRTVAGLVHEVLAVAASA